MGDTGVGQDKDRGVGWGGDGTEGGGHGVVWGQGGDGRVAAGHSRNNAMPLLCTPTRFKQNGGSSTLTQMCACVCACVRVSVAFPLHLSTATPISFRVC